eukprot:TRINITY_DN936_c0_g1_i1.p1 TRINITY_DN936_c0_g1~~TRINITY_DN936_c0_g1_i1.p1  ORF type:complete len:247 (-),score=59.20 TRINITY_DN936_c0_g1_i1:200-847(-)
MEDVTQPKLTLPEPSMALKGYFAQLEAIATREVDESLDIDGTAKKHKKVDRNGLIERSRDNDKNVRMVFENYDREIAILRHEQSQATRAELASKQDFLPTVAELKTANLRGRLGRFVQFHRISDWYLGGRHNHVATAFNDNRVPSSTKRSSHVIYSDIAAAFYQTVVQKKGLRVIQERKKQQEAIERRVRAELEEARIRVERCQKETCKEKSKKI